MNFAHRDVLWLLAALPPLLVLFFIWSGRKRQQLLTQFIQARLLPSLTVGLSPVRLRIRLACLVLACVFLILALARPQWGYELEATKLRGLDIIVAIDTSKSMLAEDIAPNRLTRAKLAALDLMQSAKSDRLGVVAFAGSAFLQCPLTIDDGAFRQSVEALDVNIIPQGGTALAEAIETARAAFKETDNYKALVLLTDGEDHDSGALDAARKAATAGMQIFTVGIGSAEGELLRIKDSSGRTDFVRDDQGNVVKSHLNEDLLRDIAKTTDYGIYLRLQGPKSIETLYQQGLSRLPKSEHEEKLVRRYRERYHVFLAIAMILLLIEMLFPERKREQESQSAKTPVKAFARAAAILLLAYWPWAAFGSTAGALREYKKGNYDEALREYQKLLRQNQNDPRLHFNAGAAAYRDKKFQEAAKEFDTALSAPDLKLQELSYYNRGNSLFQLGAQNPDPTKRTETWQRALKDFESSLKLSSGKDPDSKFNYEFVKKKLEELKQQQQQQQQQNKSDQNQDQQQQQQQQQQSQNSQTNQPPQPPQPEEQEKQQAQQQQKPEEQKQQQANQSSQQNEQQKEQQQAQQQENQQQQQQQQEAQKGSSQAEQKSDEKEQAAAAAAAAGQMSPEQAQQLLDAQKGEEQLLPVKQKEKPAERNRPFKDW